MSDSTTTPSNALSAAQSTSAASTLAGPATTTLLGPNQPTSTSTDSAVTTSRSASPVGNASAKRLSDGAVAGIAIGTFVLGALLATAFLALWQKGRSKNRKSSRERGLVSHRARDRPNEKSGFGDGTIVTGQTSSTMTDCFLSLLMMPLSKVMCRICSHKLMVMWKTSTRTVRLGSPQLERMMVSLKHCSIHNKGCLRSRK